MFFLKATQIIDTIEIDNKCIYYQGVNMSTMPKGIETVNLIQGGEMNTVSKKRNFMMIIGVTFGTLLMLFFATMLYMMTTYVGSMSRNVSNMSKSVDVMSVEVISLNKKFDTMSNNMEEVKESMLKMNENIHSIQSQMARDIDAMSTSVQDMSGNIGAMKNDVKDMSTNMGSMKKDMTKGVGKLSPRGMMRSFMP